MDDLVNRNIIAVIPARGGSKRIPQKNIIEFKGKPLIAHTIEAALESELFSRIVVSTDSRKIADISKEYGAEVPFLRKNKNDDYSHVSEATIETLQKLKEKGQFYDTVVQLMPVCPLRGSKDIKKAFEFFYDNDASFVLSCFKFVWMNPWWALTLDQNYRGSKIFDSYNQRSQDHEELYCPTGAVWIADVNALIKENTFYGKDHIFWEIDWKKAVDIDNYEDLEFAEALYFILNEQNDA